MLTCQNCHSAVALDTAFCGECGRPVFASPAPKGSVSGSITVGRDPVCEFVVDHPKVSGRHCQLRLVGNAIEVTDLGSSNGTFWGTPRQRVQAPVVLALSEILYLGSEPLHLSQLAVQLGRQLERDGQMKALSAVAPPVVPHRPLPASVPPRNTSTSGVTPTPPRTPQAPPSVEEIARPSTARAPWPEAKNPAVSAGGLGGALAFLFLCALNA